MAKVIVTCDTITNEMSVSLDGNDLPNISYASISKIFDYNYDGNPPKPKIDCCLEMTEKSGVNNEVMTRTCIYASESKEGKQAALAGHKEIVPGLVEVKNLSKVQADISKFFESE